MLTPSPDTSAFAWTSCPCEQFNGFPLHVTAILGHANNDSIGFFRNYADEAVRLRCTVDEGKILCDCGKTRFLSTPQILQREYLGLAVLQVTDH